MDIESAGDGFFQKDNTIGIKNVHLTSGEDIIGDVLVDEVHGLFVIKRPVLPNVGFDQDNKKFHVGLLPLRPYLGSLEQVEISADKVIYVVEVGEKMETLYRQFTSGLTIAGADTKLPPPPSALLR